MTPPKNDEHVSSIMDEIGDGIVPPAETAPDNPSRPGYRRIALIVACALFMQSLDSTVLATALPTMAREFGVPAPEMSLTLTAYLLALAIFIPASGTAADRFSARNVFQVAIGMFLIGSIACGFAHSLTAIVVSRFLQGLGGAMMAPVGRLLLLRSVEKRDLVSAMTWLLMPATAGPILGPPIGGLIVTYLDWRWIFWLNIPVGLLGIALVHRFIPDIRESVARRFDPRGFILSGVTLGCLLFGLELASRGNARVGVPLLVVGTVGGLLYWHHARTVAEPILDFSLLRIPTFRLALAAGSLTRITQGAQPFLLPMMMQIGFGLSAAASGSVTVATAIGSFGMRGLGRHILRRFGFRASLMTVGVAAAATYALCGLFRPGWPWPAIYAVLGASGFLMSFQLTTYNTLAYDEMPRARMSAATSFYATFQQLMLSLGICTAATALQASMAMRGHATPAFADFSAAFWTVTAISLTAILVNRRFATDAGAELSGHVRN